MSSTLGIEIHEAARDGDTVTIRTLLSSAGGQFLINIQDAGGVTPLFIAAHNGHMSATKLLIDAHQVISILRQHIQFIPDAST
jgi:ankyrin repeat protein